MKDIVILAAKRTAIGSFGGSLAGISAVELGSKVTADALATAGIPVDAVDEVILGQVLAAGAGQNPARQSAIHAGLPQEVPALTINKVCGSGLKAVHLAAQAIALGDADCVVAGGQENMSSAAHVLPGSRNGQRMGPWTMQDSMITDGLWDAFNDFHMGITAENLASKYEISRAEQDAFAAHSQHKAAAARDAGHFASQITTIDIPRRKQEPLAFAQDEFIRGDATAEGLGGLRPAFKKDGSVTAGNASGLNDGAAVVVVASADFARNHGLTPLARVVSWASAGVDPKIMGIGPVPATQRCLNKADWDIHSLDLIEANEAFAAQALAVGRELQWDADKVNVHGGAIALGHPIGASGCRILVTLTHALQQRGGGRGLATLCIGGGQGVALALETL